MSPPAPPAVTFVGHDASRTGAPIVLASLLRWLAHRGTPGVRLVLADGGPLLSEYRSLVPTRQVNAAMRNALSSASAGMRSVGWPDGPPDRLQRLLLLGEPRADVVVSNTLASLVLSTALANARRGSSARLVCHVHELDQVATRVLPEDRSRRERLLGAVDHFVATGRLVANMLVDRLGVSAERVSIVDAFIDAPELHRDEVDDVSADLRGGGTRPVVLNVAAMHRRKGPERFVDLMSALAGHAEQPIGIWLGGQPNTSVWNETADDVARAGMGDSLRLLPTVSGALSYIAAADVLVSTSIEDPYPLAVLEAAALGVPVVGFDSGGLADVLRGCNQDDLVLPVGDVLGMSDAVGCLLDDGDARAERGRALSEWVRASHTVDTQAPILWDVIRG